MGWDSPPIPWSELERKLSDRGVEGHVRVEVPHLWPHPLLAVIVAGGTDVLALSKWLQH
jgi:hypothetical protein